MVADHFNQRTANWLLEDGKHQPRCRVEPPKLRAVQEQDALLHVLEDAGKHPARLGNLDRRLGIPR